MSALQVTYREATTSCWSPSRLRERKTTSPGRRQSPTRRARSGARRVLHVIHERADGRARSVSAGVQSPTGGDDDEREGAAKRDPMVGGARRADGGGARRVAGTGTGRGPVPAGRRVRRARTGSRSERQSSVLLRARRGGVGVAWRRSGALQAPGAARLSVRSDLDRDGGRRCRPADRWRLRSAPR
jgi:hypothetical protein